MKQFTIQKWTCLFVVLAMIGCKDEGSERFEISGNITNNVSQKIYLEEVQPGSTQGKIVDSSAIDKNGHYKLNTGLDEAMVYNLRLDQSIYPLVALINDAPKITVDITLNTKERQFADSYTVKGSPASQQMKDFIYTFNNELQKVYKLALETDSLKRNGTPDSLLAPVEEAKKAQGEKIRGYALSSFEKSNNPALLLFELGYYQSTANNDETGMKPIDIEEVLAIVNKSASQFPSHKGTVAIKSRLENQLAEIEMNKRKKWIGKAAPDFSLPDVNGKQVSLSSFRGKYVLIDFWASWCGPCRDENPNVVKAFNQFKNKNFTVLGVSLDKQKQNWVKAIADDKLTWTHVSDLKYWGSSVVPLYDFTGIPYNVLVGPDGVVIAEDLRDRGLISTLEEVLK